jgi:hypothetical protein
MYVAGVTASVTVTVNAKLPSAVGVPEIVSVVALANDVNPSPEGSAPEVTAHVPAVGTVNVLDVYDFPTAAFARAMGVVSAEAESDGANVSPASTRIETTPSDAPLVNRDPNDRKFIFCVVTLRIAPHPLSSLNNALIYCLAHLHELGNSGKSPELLPIPHLNCRNGNSMVTRYQQQILQSTHSDSFLMGIVVK